MALLEDQKADTSTVYSSRNGEIRYYGKLIRDSYKGGYGDISLGKALIYSSNTIFAQAIDQVYSKKPIEFTSKFKKYQLGVNLDLPFTSTSKPIIPQPNSKYWSSISLPWMGFGYGLILSPIEILTYYNAIANNGEAVKPLFVNEIKKLGINLSLTARPLRFGTWIGGDRDGNPNITAAVTKSAILLQNAHFTRTMFSHLDELRQALSISTKLAGVSKELEKSVEKDLENLPEVEARYRRINVEEPYRLKATAIRHKLSLTQSRHAAGLPHFPGRDYKDTTDLLKDFEVMRSSLLANNGELIANGLLDRIMRSINAFGLTHATMDIREHSEVHHKLLNQV